ncbi:MAG: hypothetical protein KDB54_02705 [Solirubrobacterales bacterium]|nr:hypothetical protein [Solirubrobacterales bacterium]
MTTTRFDIRHLAGAVAAIVALSLGVSACGGGDDGETTAPVTTTTTTEQTVVLTKQELISQGDDVCAEANSALGSIETSTADETTKSSQIADIYDGIAQQLGDLGTPSDGDPPTDVIAAAQQIAAGTGDTTDFTTAAGEYGFTDCAQAPEATSYPTDSTSTDSTSTDSSSTETYTPPTTDSTETYTPPATTTAPDTGTGGGVAPTTPSTGGGTSTGGSSSGGTSSGGIGPG